MLLSLLGCLCSLGHGTSFGKALIWCASWCWWESLCWSAVAVCSSCSWRRSSLASHWSCKCILHHVSVHHVSEHVPIHHHPYSHLIQHGPKDFFYLWSFQDASAYLGIRGSISTQMPKIPKLNFNNYLWRCFPPNSFSTKFQLSFAFLFFPHKLNFNSISTISGVFYFSQTPFQLNFNSI